MADVHRKLTGQVFPTQGFLDTSLFSPEETVRRLVGFTTALSANIRETPNPWELTVEGESEFPACPR